MSNEMQGSPENYKGMYAGLKFEPYRYREYPKVIYSDETKKHQLGIANNAMEEKELYASIGVEKGDIDPLGAAQDEIAELRARLSQYEGNDPSKQLAAKTGGVKTNTVEMLPEGAPAAAAPAAPATSNPLLKPKDAAPASSGQNTLVTGTGTSK